MIKIVVDAMGGDNAPAEIVKGAVAALEKDKDLKVVLTGDKEKIGQTLSELSYGPGQKNGQEFSGGHGNNIIEFPPNELGIADSQQSTHSVYTQNVHNAA